MKIKALYPVVLIFTLLLCTGKALADEIDVKLDNVINNQSVTIDFDNLEPMKIDNSTVVPLRRFCESAGLAVHWYDYEKKAVIELKGNIVSSLPVERYAARLLSENDTKGLNLIPHNITATLSLNSDYITLRYNYKDIEGDIVSVGKKIKLSVPVSIMGNSVVVPLRGLMEVFGLWVEWSDGTVIVSIPPFDTVPLGLEFMAAEDLMTEEVFNEQLYAVIPQPIPALAPAPVVVADDRPAGVPAGAEFLGNFKITHYCACSKCCGSYGNATAWAGPIRPGVTIAVDPKVIPKLSEVYIDGYGIRRAEDCGGAIKGNKIDIAVSNHSEAMKLGVVYKDVWIVK